MPRTTIDIDAPILRDLKRLQKEQGKPLGRIVSDLLARALGERRPRATRATTMAWISHPMRTRVDLDDKEAVHAALDRDA